jgi:hypothetical protein
MVGNNSMKHTDNGDAENEQQARSVVHGSYSRVSFME